EPVSRVAPPTMTRQSSVKITTPSQMRTILRSRSRFCVRPWTSTAVTSAADIIAPGNGKAVKMPRSKPLICPMHPCKTSPGALRHAVAGVPCADLRREDHAAKAAEFHRNEPDHLPGDHLCPRCDNDRYLDARQLPL